VLDRDLKFDHFQFQDHHSMYPVSAGTEIAFEDFRRGMRTQFRSPSRAWVPPFALNDKQLRTVLLHRAWFYCHHTAPPEAVDWKTANAKATAHALRSYEIRPDAPAQIAMRDAHIAAVKRAGGYLQLIASCAFRAWRLGQDSVAVGDSLGISPCSVRVMLQRIRDVARKLGYDVGKPHPSRGSARYKASARAAWQRRKMRSAVLDIAPSAHSERAGRLVPA